MTLTIFNDDPAARDVIGKNTAVLYWVKFGGASLGKLDASAEALEEEIEFTFEDFDIPDKLLM